jgi:hypothetical protein
MNVCADSSMLDSMIFQELSKKVVLPLQEIEAHKVLSEIVNNSKISKVLTVAKVELQIRFIVNIICTKSQSM